MGDRDRKKDMKEVKELGTFFALIGVIKTHLQQSQAPETHGKVWSKEELISLEEYWFREHLNKMDVQKSTGPDGRHAQVLVEFDDVNANPDNL